MTAIKRALKLIIGKSKIKIYAGSVYESLSPAGDRMKS